MFREAHSLEMEPIVPGDTWSTSWKMQIRRGKSKARTPTGALSYVFPEQLQSIGFVYPRK